MPFFWKKKKEIENMLASYFKRCDNCIELFRKAFDTYLEHGYGKEFELAVDGCHEAESAADDLRREIVMTLYAKALLPESRGDLLGLLETYDTLPNMVETVVYIMLCQKVEIPKELRPDFTQLVNVNQESYFQLRKAVDALFNNPRLTLHATKEVDEKESESDRIERNIIKKIFSNEGDTGDKILLRDLVLAIGEVSDRAEKTADRIAVVAIKRQI